MVLNSLQNCRIKIQTSPKTFYRYTGYMTGMATHRQGALVAAAPASHATQAIANAKADFSVSVKVPDTINLLAGGYARFSSPARLLWAMRDSCAATLPMYPFCHLASCRRQFVCEYILVLLVFVVGIYRPMCFFFLFCCCFLLLLGIR